MPSCDKYIKNLLTRDVSGAHICYHVEQSMVNGYAKTYPSNDFTKHLTNTNSGKLQYIIVIIDIKKREWNNFTSTCIDLYMFISVVESDHWVIFWLLNFNSRTFSGLVTNACLCYIKCDEYKTWLSHEMFYTGSTLIRMWPCSPWGYFTVAISLRPGYTVEFHANKFASLCVCFLM